MAAAARVAGVDMSKVPASAARAEAELDRNMRVARDIGASGTPTWVIGKRVISAAMPLETLQAAIAEARSGR